MCCLVTLLTLTSHKVVAHKYRRVKHPFCQGKTGPTCQALLQVPKLTR